MNRFECPKEVYLITVPTWGSHDNHPIDAVYVKDIGPYNASLICVNSVIVPNTTFNYTFVS